ncbi:MAG: hypothetical protein II838_03760 [Lachnospiraceae bacterium]|nr:hypothetical protein [Lachnospiraceae bacterium]
MLLQIFFNVEAILCYLLTVAVTKTTRTLLLQIFVNDFTIDQDGVPICPCGFRMRRDGVEAAKGRMKFKCPKISRKNGCLSCTGETPCSNAKYGRTVHLVINLS